MGYWKFIKLAELRNLTSVKSRHKFEVPNEIWFVCSVTNFGSSDGGTLKKSG